MAVTWEHFPRKYSRYHSERWVWKSPYLAGANKLWGNFNIILFKIQAFSFMEMHLKMPSAKCLDIFSRANVSTLPRQHRDQSVHGLSQWETTLQYKIVSHWPSPYPELSLQQAWTHPICHKNHHIKRVNSNSCNTTIKISTAPVTHRKLLQQLLQINLMKKIHYFVPNHVKTEHTMLEKIPQNHGSKF